MPFASSEAWLVHPQSTESLWEVLSNGSLSTWKSECIRHENKQGNKYWVHPICPVFSYFGIRNSTWSPPHYVSKNARAGHVLNPWLAGAELKGQGSAEHSSLPLPSQSPSLHPQGTWQIVISALSTALVPFIP